MKQRKLAACGRSMLPMIPLPCTLISFHDPDTDVPKAPDGARQMVLPFYDTQQPSSFVTADRKLDAKCMLRFIDDDTTGQIVFQCEAGASRSMAAMAALMHLDGRDPDMILRRGAYNRGWYKTIMKAGGIEITEPLVSMVCRIKYPDDRALAFYLSMKRQRHENWETIFVTDGPRALPYLRPMINDGRSKVIETMERRGRWGHPYRQLGIDAAKGDYICLSNDDNYYTPGYLEQMVYKMQREGLDLCLCDMLHSYNGWGVTTTHITPEDVSCDVGNFMVKRSLIEQVKWPGNEFDSDGVFVRRLAEKADKVGFLHKPLFVKN